MALSLREYSTLHSRELSEDENNAISANARDYDTMQQAEAEAAQAEAQASAQADERQHAADELKAGIERQLQGGNDPFVILSMAIRAIGIATDDTAWSDRQIDTLRTVYPDVEQQTLLAETAEAKAEKLREKREKYDQYARRQLKGLINGYTKLLELANDAYAAQCGITDQCEPTETE